FPCFTPGARLASAVRKRWWPVKLKIRMQQFAESSVVTLLDRAENIEQQLAIRRDAHDLRPVLILRRLVRQPARLLVAENAVEHERLNVTVENDANKFAGFVHDRPAAVAADDVGVGDEIEMGRKTEIGFLIDPPLRQIEWSLVIVFGGTLI